MLRPEIERVPSVLLYTILICRRISKRSDWANFRRPLPPRGESGRINESIPKPPRPPSPHSSAPCSPASPAERHLRPDQPRLSEKSRRQRADGRPAGAGRLSDGGRARGGRFRGHQHLRLHRRRPRRIVLGHPRNAATETAGADRRRHRGRLPGRARPAGAVGEYPEIDQLVGVFARDQIGAGGRPGSRWRAGRQFPAGCNCQVPWPNSGRCFAPPRAAAGQTPIACGSRRDTWRS